MVGGPNPTIHPSWVIISRYKSRYLTICGATMKFWFSLPKEIVRFGDSHHQDDGSPVLGSGIPKHSPIHRTMTGWWWLGTKFATHSMAADWKIHLSFRNLPGHHDFSWKMGCISNRIVFRNHLGAQFTTEPWLWRWEKGYISYLR